MKVNLSQIISNYFSNLIEGNSKQIVEFEAWVLIKESGDFGVAVKYSGEKINESFANVKFYTADLEFGAEHGQYLLLMSSLKESIEEFSLICAHFISFEREVSERVNRLKDPYEWWNQWRDLIGNAVRNAKPYSILGEMIIYLYMLRNNFNIEWMPSNYRTHDLVTDEFSSEVKSTLSKYDDNVTINSQFQLDELDYLYTVKFEKDRKGISINDILEDIVEIKNNKKFIEKELTIVGYPEGNSARKEKYKILEIREYKVGKDFPGYELNEFLKKFKDPYVSKITYQVNLNGHPFEKILI